MQLLQAVWVLVWSARSALRPPRRKSHRARRLPESEPNRRQPWPVPSPDPATAAHAILFRAAGDGPFPPGIVAHATSQNLSRRAQMPQPDGATGGPPQPVSPTGPTKR